MTAQTLSTIALGLYGVVAIAGGILGFVKSQSKASIISGSLSGSLLLFAAYLLFSGQEMGRLLGIGITALLIAVFVIRWVKTRKVMPAAAMIAIGCLTLIPCIWTLFVNQG
ncbi:MAG: hypothetical protein HC919_04325 [Oscillatoriales cyanobacterium SM2_2_1]|nr:hypothetical protein [Oscillatoriales cyanobacterium SM2_2_1]